MSDDIQGGEYLKPDTQEILNELEAEGNTIEGREAKVEEPAAEEPKVEEPQKPTEEPASEPAKAEDEPETPKAPRSVQAVPVGKYNEERHKRQEAEKRAADAEAQLAGRSPSTAPTEINEAVAKLAEKHGIDAEILTDLATTITDAVGQKVAIPDDYKQAIDQLREMTQKQQEEAAYEADFGTVAKALADEGLDITGHKDKIKELAYTEGYTGTSLRAIALEYAHDNGLLSQGRKTAERSSGGRALAETTVIDFDSISEAEAKKLPDDQWEKYVEHQIKKQHTGQGIRT